MPNTLYGKKIKGFKRYATAERWTGQARLPEWKYYSLPYQYDASVEANVDKYQIGLVVAQHPKFLADGTTPNPKAGEVAPYVKGDPLLGTPFGIILETRDLETELNVPVYLKGSWDCSVVPVVGFTDIKDAAEIKKGINARLHMSDGATGGILFWDATLPSA